MSSQIYFKQNIITSTQALFHGAVSLREAVKKLNRKNGTLCAFQKFVSKSQMIVVNYFKFYSMRRMMVRRRKRQEGNDDILGGGQTTRRS